MLCAKDGEVVGLCDIDGFKRNIGVADVEGVEVVPPKRKQVPKPTQQYKDDANKDKNQDKSDDFAAENAMETVIMITSKKILTSITRLSNLPHISVMHQQMGRLRATKSNSKFKFTFLKSHML